jgi:hypothetical protein
MLGALSAGQPPSEGSEATGSNSEQALIQKLHPQILRKIQIL